MMAEMNITSLRHLLAQETGDKARARRLANMLDGAERRLTRLYEQRTRLLAR
jgi:hypothetical protein